MNTKVNNQKTVASGRPISNGVRKLLVISCWVVVVSLGCVYIPQQAQPEIDYNALYRDLLYPSVRITTADSIGSGVIIDTPSPFPSRGGEGLGEGFYILTAAHVVGDEALVSVELFNSAKTLPAFVVATDTGKDLALLQIPTTNFKIQTNFRIARLAPRDYIPRIFTPVWVVGCSLGFPPRPSEGIITAISPSPFPSRGGEGLGEGNWEISAPILPGNSGGGVFDGRTHELIGIAVWVRVYQGQLITTMAGIVPINQIYEFLDSRR